jgi:hypothetical protein
MPDQPPRPQQSAADEMAVVRARCRARAVAASFPLRLRLQSKRLLALEREQTACYVRLDARRRTMAQRDDDSRQQQQQGSTGQRSEGQGGGHRQADLPGDHGGQHGGKAGPGKAGPGGAGQRRQEGGESQPGAEERSGGEQQRQEGAREDGPDADEQARGARATQGNLGTTQREWSNRDNTADSDQE